MPSNCVRAFGSIALISNSFIMFLVFGGRSGCTGRMVGVLSWLGYLGSEIVSVLDRVGVPSIGI